MRNPKLNTFISSVIIIVFIILNNSCYVLHNTSVSHSLDYGLRSAQHDLYPLEINLQEIVDNYTLKNELTETGLIINRGGKANSSVRLCIRILSVGSCTPKQLTRSYPLLPLVVNQAGKSRPFDFEKCTFCNPSQDLRYPKTIKSTQPYFIIKEQFLVLAYRNPLGHKKSPADAYSKNFAEPFNINKLYFRINII